MKCVKCGGNIDPEVVRDDYSELFATADALGMEALTEDQQLLVDGELCAECCSIML